MTIVQPLPTCLRVHPVFQVAPPLRAARSIDGKDLNGYQKFNSYFFFYLEIVRLFFCMCDMEEKGYRHVMYFKHFY